MLKDTARFEVARTPKGNKGSRVLTAVFLVLLIGVPGAAYYFYSDTSALVRHVRERDGLAAVAAHVLAAKGPPRDEQEMLLQALVDADMSPEFRAGVAKCLGQMKSEDGQFNRTLGQASQEDPSPAVRAAALRAMGDNGYATLAQAYVARGLREDDAEPVRQAAAYATGKLGLRRLIPDVINLLHSPISGTRSAAQQALETFTNPGESYGHDIDAWKRWYDK